ncbi:unnamed protein product [Schistocephalus solidus]|uniref:Lactamase_B domain-containing protein n=1 Tax=Schistocephalus solidus TaxID=70667 RepID=A0A183T970_SCHSO|nr:unnamed protein product [Schistocephalus solidus]
MLEIDSTIKKDIKSFDDVPWQTVDVILVSYALGLVLLPYLTESMGFRGRVLATSPVVNMGKVIIEDVLNESEHIAQEPTDSKLASANGQLPVDELLHCCLLKYTSDQAASAFSKIQTVAYQETVPMDFSEFSDVDVLIVGSLNTSQALPFEQALEKVCTVTVQTLALGGHVLVPCLPSGLVFQLLESIATAKHHFNGHLLEAFDRHFELDPSPSSSDPQVVDLATDQPPAKNTTSAKGVIHNSVNSSISGGGVSLMSLIAKCPLLFISSQAKASLAYANACGEWLSPDREKSLYTADSPFPFESLIRTGQMATLSSLHSPMSVDPKLDCAAVANGSSNPSSAPSFFTLPRRVNTGPTESQARSDVAGIEGGLWPALPCVFFTGHPSCRLGSAVHLIRALAYGGLRTEGFTKGPPPQHSVILVQSDEFLSRHDITGLHGTPQSNLVRLMRPFMDGCANEMSNQHSSILRLNNDAAAVYWIPIRAGITMNQLSRILTSCGFPKQTLILPSEVSASSELQVSGRCSVHHLAHNEELSVELAAPSLLPVHISPAILKSALPLSINLAGNTSTTTMTTTTTKVSNRPSDPRAAANRTPEPASQKPLQLALLSGRLHFRDEVAKRNSVATRCPYGWRDGRGGESVTRLYRLDEVDSTEAPTLGASSPGVMRPPSPSSATVSAASGTARTLIAKTSALDPQRLIKALTESGVTGGQLAGPELLAKYLEQEARQIGLAGRIQMTCSASPLGPLTASNSALILFVSYSVDLSLSANSH